MSKFTEGPWEWSASGQYLQTVDHDHILLGLFNEGPGLGTEAQKIRRLIAAAPDMYERLKEALVELEHSSQESQLHEAIRTLLEDIDA